MEYVLGQTLKQKLQASSLTTRESLEIAVEMAEALEEAHSQSIVHRDLKPANIMLTEQGHVKITDFGLAKWVPLVEGEEQEYTETLTREVSTEGTIPYMSPEQVTGRKVDPRSDIFSFGVVLYEMLTRVNPFRKSLPMETAAAIQMAEIPPIREYREGTPEGLEVLLTTMLAKQPERRQGSIGEVRESLVELLEEEERSPAQPLRVIQKLDLPVDRDTTDAGAERAIFWKLAPWIAAIALAVLTGFAGWTLKPEEPRRVVRSVIPIPQTAPLRIAESFPSVAISPDGRQIVYGAQVGGERQLYLRPVDQLEAFPIRGSEGSQNPFFSPDGSEIGFWDGPSLKKVPVQGGNSVTLGVADDDGLVGGTTWGADGRIIFGTYRDGLFQVKTGEEPQVLTTPDPEKGEESHRLPEILPGGKAVFFVIRKGLRSNHIAVLDLETLKHHILVPGSHPHYSLTGHIVYFREEALLAVSFDPARLEVTGEPVALPEKVTKNNHVNFRLSSQESLVYVRGSSPLAERLQMVWVDRNGKEDHLGADPRPYHWPRVSPDGDQVAVIVDDSGNLDVWIHDLVHHNPSRLTVDESMETFPLWSPDGQYVAFASDRDGPTPNLYMKKADGTGEVEPLQTITVGVSGGFPLSWSPDGKLLVFVQLRPNDSKPDIGILSMDGVQPPRLLLDEGFSEVHPAISPDGRWIAYSSNETGRYEIYVRPFPNVDDDKQLISNDGGGAPVWSPDGKELFYRSANEKRMMVVSVQTESSFTHGTPRVLFEAAQYESWNIAPKYDIHPDGERFLMLKKAPHTEEAPAPMELILVLNWSEELKRLVPTNK